MKPGQAEGPANVKAPRKDGVSRPARSMWPEPQDQGSSWRAVGSGGEQGPCPDFDRLWRGVETEERDGTSWKAWSRAVP